MIGLDWMCQCASINHLLFQTSNPCVFFLGFWVVLHVGLFFTVDCRESCMVSLWCHFAMAIYWAQDGSRFRKMEREWNTDWCVIVYCCERGTGVSLVFTADVPLGYSTCVMGQHDIASPSWLPFYLKSLAPSGKISIFSPLLLLLWFYSFQAAKADHHHHHHPHPHPHPLTIFIRMWQLESLCPPLHQLLCTSLQIWSYFLFPIFLPLTILSTNFNIKRSHFTSFFFLLTMLCISFSKIKQILWHCSG